MIKNLNNSKSRTYDMKKKLSRKHCQWERKLVKLNDLELSNI